MGTRWYMALLAACLGCGRIGYDERRASVDAPTVDTSAPATCPNDMTLISPDANVCIEFTERGDLPWTTAKAALAANTVTWSREFAPFGIRVGAVAPGMIETPMTQGMNQKARDALVANIPVGRIGLPEDIWVAVKFVLECDYFNGRTIDVDGGLAM